MICLIVIHVKLTFYFIIIILKLWLLVVLIYKDELLTFITLGRSSNMVKP